MHVRKICGFVGNKYKSVFVFTGRALLFLMSELIFKSIIASKLMTTCPSIVQSAHFIQRPLEGAEDVIHHPIITSGCMWRRTSRGKIELHGPPPHCYVMFYIKRGLPHCGSGSFSNCHAFNLPTSSETQSDVDWTMQVWEHVLLRRLSTVLTKQPGQSEQRRL